MSGKLNTPTALLSEEGGWAIDTEWGLWRMETSHPFQNSNRALQSVALLVKLLY